MIRALRGVAIAACAVAAVWVTVEVARYEGARAAWVAERDRIGTDAYDAARSDAAYAEVEARRAGARGGAWALAGAVLIAASLAGRGTASESETSAGRLLVASALDVVSTALLLALAAWLASQPSSLAISDALARVLPSVAIAVPLATLSRGTTLGMRTVAVRVDAPAPWRAALAIALLPLTAAWLVLALVPLAVLVALGRAPRAAWLAPHLAIAGIRVASGMRASTRQP